MRVQLQWNRNVEPDMSGYNVYRGTVSGGPYTKINATLVAQPPEGLKPQYTDNPTPDATYYYVVRAVNIGGLESVNSNEAVANPLPPKPPSAPTGLTAAAVATVSLSVDNVPAAGMTGQIPIAMEYTLPRSTPPRDRRLTIKVA